MSHTDNTYRKYDLQDKSITDDSVGYIISNIPADIVVIDDSGVIRFSSRSAEISFRGDAETLTGIQLKSIIIDSEGRIAVDTMLSNEDNEKAFHSFKATLSMNNGCMSAYEITYSNITVEGKLHYILTLTPLQIVDHSAKIEKLEHQAAIGTFTSGIAHEFNNILAGIRGYTQLAQNDISDSSLVTKAFNVIEKETSRGAQLCKNLSLYSGNRPLNLEPVDLANSIKQIIDSQSDFLTEYNIGISTEFDDIPPVIADKQRIFQLLTNLVTNARHAVMPGGNGHISITLKNDEKFIKIRVADDGIGISPDQIEHIFEPFFSARSVSRVDKHQTTEMRGTGLGLPVCQVIAKQHGGSITVTSGQDEGTVFTVYIPKKFAHVFSGNSGVNLSKYAQSRPVRVLVVDDEMAIREIVYRTLCNLDTETSLASNMTELQEIIMNHVFDLIFLDYVLPEMNSDRILPVLRDKFPRARIVMISGWNGSPGKKAQLEKTVDAWIDKPFNVDIISEQVRICRKTII